MTADALPLAIERSARRSGQARAEAVAAYLLSAPAIVCLLAILILPTLATVVLSFTDWQFGAKTLRWIGFGVFMPRFSIHSWNDDGTVNEPWMYPEHMAEVQSLMRLRERHGETDEAVSLTGTYHNLLRMWADS